MFAYFLDKTTQQRKCLESGNKQSNLATGIVFGSRFKTSWDGLGHSYCLEAIN
jgi:hypothetical protein